MIVTRLYLKMNFKNANKKCLREIENRVNDEW